MTSKPPGPGRLFYLRHKPEVFVAMARKYGDILSFTIGPREVWLVSRPDLIAQILRDHYSHFQKDWGPRRGHPLLDKSLVTTEGADHRAQRQQFAKLFTRGAIAAQRNAIAEVVEEWIASRRHGETIDLYREMSMIGVDVAARVLFGSRVDSAASFEMSEVVMRGFRKIILPFAIKIRPPDARPHAAAMVEQLRRHRYRDGLLSPLFDLPDADVHIRTFLITGQETIRMATAWGFFLLSSHPEIRARLQAEAREGRSIDYAEAVLMEAMRLYPPQWMVGKRAITDYPLDGWTIPRGAAVLVSQYIVQRDERWFPDADRFVPERWLGGEMNPAYFPFGGGPRRCIGEAFAMLEGTLMLSLIARDLNFECARKPPAFDARLTLKPRSMKARVVATR